MVAHQTGTRIAFAGTIALVVGCGVWTVPFGLEAVDGDTTQSTVDAARDARGVVVDAQDGADGGHDARVGREAGHAHDGSMVAEGGDDAGSPCPPAAPSSGSACTDVGRECEYGSNASVACNQLWHCTTSGWARVIISSPCVTGVCPATYAALATGSTCAPRGEVCGYDAGTCTCGPSSTTAMPEDGGARWSCFPEQAGCPSPRPAIGAACASGATCNYGRCAGGLELGCADGGWASLASTCGD